MVTTEFKKNAYEGYDAAQNEVTLATGNAFAPDQMKRETINALQNAMMNGADDDSSIATAAMKLSGHFKSSASKQNDKKDKGLSMAEMALLQQVNDYLRDINDRISDLNNDIEFLKTIDDDSSIMTANSREEMSQQDQAKFDRYLEEVGITEEEHFAMSTSERVKVRDEAINSKEELAQELGDKRDEALEQLRDNPNDVLIEPLAVTNNVFEDEVYENAAQLWEQDNGDLDRHNIPVNVYEELIDIVEDIERNALKEALDIARVSDADSELKSDIDRANGLVFKM